MCKNWSVVYELDRVISIFLIFWTSSNRPNTNCIALGSFMRDKHFNVRNLPNSKQKYLISLDIPSSMSALLHIFLYVHIPYISVYLYSIYFNMFKFHIFRYIYISYIAVCLGIALILVVSVNCSTEINTE